MTAPHDTTPRPKTVVWAAICLLVTAALPLGAPLTAAPVPDPFEVVFEAIDEGIWVTQRPRPERQPVMGNGTIIINDDHVVVIDGAGSPLLAERIISGIRQRTDLPVRYLVFTHWHGDHNLGAWRYVDAWPDLEIISQHFTRQAMQGAPMDYVAEIQATTGEQIDLLRPVAESGLMPDGKPVPPHMLADFRDLVAFGDLMTSEILASRITIPNRTFTDRQVLDEGGRVIELLHFGDGNTAGDAVAWLPAERILVTGDVVVAPTPYGFHSYPRAWITVLSVLKTLQAEQIVPGHGPVLDNDLYLNLLIDAFDHVADQAEAAVEEGEDFEYLRKNMNWGDIPARFTLGDPTLESRWRQWFATPIIQAAWNEAAGVENEPLQRKEPE